MRLRIALATLFTATATQAADWKPTESTKHYSVPGTSGMAIYRAIGELGPEPSIGRRAIAYTDWDLKWRRDYQPSGGGCTLAAAKPFLTITYTLPKAKAQLTGSLKQRWNVFYQGMKTHEWGHGDLLVAMTNRIIESTVGLRVEGDSGCKKIRQEVLKNVEREYHAYRDQSAAFDREEMSQGGNVHQLIFQLVEGN